MINEVILRANKEHLKILKRGVAHWNKWREDNPDIEPNLINANLENEDLSHANLSHANLSYANLSYAILSGAEFSVNKLNVVLDDPKKPSNVIFVGSDNSEAGLSYANLSHANLSHANLNYTNLNYANLSYANLSYAKLKGAHLSGAIINERTDYRKVKECRIGINGFYCRETNSAALIKLSPPGDSMQGADPNSIIENLKRARRLHGSSMLLAAMVLIVVILGLEEIKFTTVDVGKISPGNFVLLAMPISLGFLILVRSFMVSALSGIRYLNDRNSVMMVGNFPWALSKYEISGYYSFSVWINRFLSFSTRLVMCFHPFIYAFYWGENINKVFFISSFTLLMVFSLLIFFLSQQFQKPILFDNKTEEERKSELEKLTEAVQDKTFIITEQTLKIAELIDLLKKRKR